MKLENVPEEFERFRNRNYTFTAHSYDVFTNYIINSNVRRLVSVFCSDRAWFDKEKEYIATNKDEILGDALISCCAITFDLESFGHALVVENKFKSKYTHFDIPEILFPADQIKKTGLRNLLLDIFVVRDSIVHAHSHEVRVKIQNFKVAKASVHISKNRPSKQGLDFKYKETVSLRTKKTKYANLNVAIPKISLIDVLKMLIVLDIVNKYTVSWPKMDFSYRPEHYWDKKEDEWGLFTLDLTYIILNFINHLSPSTYVNKELLKFVKKLQRIFPDVPHGPFKQYRLYKYDLWNNVDFLKYDAVDFV